MKRYLLSALCLLSLVSGPAFAETMDEALLSGLVKSDNLNAARQNYIAVRETLTIANASNDLTGTVTITGAQTETDRKILAADSNQANLFPRALQYQSSYLIQVRVTLGLKRLTTI